MLAAGTHWKIKYKTASQGKKENQKLNIFLKKYQMTFKNFVMDTMEQNIGCYTISGMAAIASTR